MTALGCSTATRARSTTQPRSSSSGCSGSSRSPDTPHNPAWQPSRLEYRFTCSAPSTGENIYTADEYDNGDARLAQPRRRSERGDARLRDRLRSARANDEDDDSSAVGLCRHASSPLVDDRGRSDQFRRDSSGYHRFWPSCCSSNSGSCIRTTGSSCLSRCRAARSLRCRDSRSATCFGERFWIEAAGKGPNDALAALEPVHPRLSKDPVDARRREPRPPADRAQGAESAPLEEVLLIRDEMANMVWGVEKTVPAPDGRGRSGITLGREDARVSRATGRVRKPSTPARTARQRREDPLRPHERGAGALDPVHRRPRARQSARDPVAACFIACESSNAIPLTPPERLVKPRTTLLRPGLDKEGSRHTSFPKKKCRAAARASLRRSSATRWLDGRVFVWLGIRKQTGRGEGSSGLAYDRIVEKKYPV